MFKIKISEKRSHTEVLEILDKMGQHVRNIREDLKSLMDNRNIADYEDDMRIRFLETAQDSILLANDIIENVNELNG